MRDGLKWIVGFGLLFVLGGCSHVNSAMGGNTAQTGEAWWVKTVSFPPGLVWSAKVYHCPAPASGPAQCKEAKMVEAE